MKRLMLLAILAGCSSHPATAPAKGHWVGLVWRYYDSRGKVCGGVNADGEGRYLFLTYKDDGDLLYSQMMQFDSDDEAKSAMQRVCDSR